MPNIRTPKKKAPSNDLAASATARGLTEYRDTLAAIHEDGTQGALARMSHRVPMLARRFHTRDAVVLAWLRGQAS